ncbi:MAG: xanthine dehydrogenase family protein [Deltaproteobacteria bacterium]|nr:xanthine dehydrogenase family protein [Deltaproteobacteria bacterium]
MTADRSRRRAAKRPPAARRATPRRKTHSRPDPLPTVVGKSPRRVDAGAKASGTARYTADLSFANLLVGYPVTSRFTHARIRRIDVSAARRVPGVVAVLTAEDVPGQNQIGVVIADQPLLAHDLIRSAADRVALIAALTREAALAAARLVVVEAEPLPLVCDPVAALEPSAPLLHPRGNLAAKMVIRTGDYAKARAKAPIVLEQTFTTGHQEHAYLEPNAVVAVPDAGGMFLTGSMQCPFYVQKGVARVLGLSHAQIRVVQAPTGGGFGGKEDYPSEPAACAAVLAHHTGRPVRILYNRSEDIAWSSKRHRTVIKHTLLADRDGKLVGLKATIYVDAGAYLGLSSVVAERANASAGGPYRIPNVEVDTLTAYTNNPFGGAYRGFGQPQVTFALESQLDALARELGADPIELRLKNFLRQGSRTVTDEVLRQPPLAARTAVEARDRSRWAAKRRAAETHNAADPDRRHGVGVASMLYGCCLHAGGQHLEGSAALVQIHPDASVSIAIGASEIGQGAYTAMAMLAAEALGFAYDQIHVVPTDTALVPDSGPTVASRTTIMSGNAVLDAARTLGARLRPVAAELCGVAESDVVLQAGAVWARGKQAALSIAELVTAAYLRKVNLAHTGWYAPPKKLWDKATGRGQPYSLYCYGTLVAEVSVDTITGLVTVQRVTAVHDVGKAIYGDGVIGQIHGGIVQGLGYATMERLAVADGKILNPTFTDYLIPTALDVPEIDIGLIEEPYERGPYGAKGIGEPALIPVAAAIANAVSHALGFPLQDLPLSPERVKLGWEAHRSPAAAAP